MVLAPTDSKYPASLVAGTCSPQVLEGWKIHTSTCYTRSQLEHPREDRGHGEAEIQEEILTRRDLGHVSRDHGNTKAT